MVHQVRFPEVVQAERSALFQAVQSVASRTATQGTASFDPNGFAKRQFASAVEAAQLGAVRFHDLRHSFGSHLLDQGCNIYDVQRWMGHSSIQVTLDVYGHGVTDHGQEAMAKRDAFLFAKKAAD